MNLADELKAEIEATAERLGIAPSTVGKRAGQGGRFYARLCEGRRVWPETAHAVRDKLGQMAAPVAAAPLKGAQGSGSLPAAKNMGASQAKCKGAA